MKTVYFVRHGEAQNNVGHPVYLGEAAELTEEGVKQAHFIAERAKRLDFEVVIASPAARAKNTAEIIAKQTEKKIETEEIFTERILPSRLVGLSRDDSEGKRIVKAWEQSLYDPTVRIEDGENFDGIKRRAATALAYLENHSASKIIVVTHGFFLRAIAARVLFGEDMTPDEFKKIIATFRTSNTGLTLMEYGSEQNEAWGMPQNPWSIRVWNDHAHLG